MLFKTAKAALEAQVDFIARRDDLRTRDVYPLLRPHLEKMAEEWRSGTFPEIDYADPYCRAAYVYGHVPVNANLCLNALRKSKILDYAIKQESLHAVAFGGGPGTELLALAKLFFEAADDEREFDTVDVQLDVLDFTNEWSESINCLHQAIRDRYKRRFGHRKNWPAILTPSFARVDFLESDSFANFPSLLDATCSFSTTFCQSLRKTPTRLSTSWLRPSPGTVRQSECC